MKKLVYLFLFVSFTSFSQDYDDNAYLKRGMSKDDLKDYKGAIEDYTKAIEINPNNADAYFNRGVSKSNSEDDKGAIEDYTKVIEINPNDTDAYYNRGVLKEGLKFLGDFELQDSLGIFLILRNIDLSIKCQKYTQSTY